ncbi:site-specific integrase [Desulforhopalus sp. 52FAK]
MTEAVGIRKDVPNREYHSTPQIYPTRGIPATTVLSDKRRTLDRWINRIKTSNLPGDNLAVEHLREKYIKNLSLRTIDNSSDAILHFLYFLDTHGRSILTLTIRGISAFVEYEQDRGLKASSVSCHLSTIYAFLNHLVGKGHPAQSTLAERSLPGGESDTLQSRYPDSPANNRLQPAN